MLLDPQDFLILRDDFLINDGVSLFFFCFIDTRDLVPIQIFIISLMFSLKKLHIH